MQQKPAGGRSGARTMQEFKYFRDGAALVISLDGLNWLSKRRCSDKGLKKRDKELQLWISSGEMIQADEELSPINCFCILDERENAAPWSWRDNDRRSSLVAQPLSFIHQQCCLPAVPTHQSTLTSLVSSEGPKEALWTRIILNMQDIFRFIKKDLNIVTQQDEFTKNQHNRFIIFCNADIPLQLFGDTCYNKDSRTSIGDAGWHSSDKVLCDQKNSAHCSTISNPEGIQHELVSRDHFNTCNLKSPLKCCQICDGPRTWDKNVKKRKSVSFDDDVLIYLFNQESPTMELHSGPCTSLSSSQSNNLPDPTLEDSGLEWEDDFSALEKSCHLQCVRQSTSRQRSLSLPTRGCPALSKRLFLSQTCLFLTHVTESDLEP